MNKIESLKNGLKIAADPMPHMESVSLGIWIRAGGRYENEKNSGISHLLEHLLFKGTEKRDMVRIKQEIEGRGGSFNGFTSEEHTCYLVKVLAKDAELGVDILSDMVLHPRLDVSEVVKEKSVIIEEINMYKDIPGHYVHELLAEMMWPDQPLGMPLAGTVETVSSLDRAQVASYRDMYYNPTNMLIVGTGRITDGLLKALAAGFMEKASPAAASKFDKVKITQDCPRLKLHPKNTEQTHLAIGIHAIDRFHPDRYAMSVLNVILGANMSSRLFHIVRDEMALCYEISSTVRRYEDCGAFVISAGIDHQKVPKALETMMGQLDRIKREPVSADELKRAKEYYRGQLLFALEDTMSRMLWIGERLISGKSECNAAEIIRNIERVSADDIMRVASETLKDEKLNMAIIGPMEDKERRIAEVLHIR